MHSAQAPDMTLNMSAVGRTLDFIIIGAQKAGTTTLWQHLRQHPSISMPATKEAPFFCKAESTRADAFDVYMASCFEEVAEGTLLGKATPHYMMGSDEGDVEQIAERIFTMLPGVRLIALLRDPIERAISQYRMSVRRGWEERTLDAALRDQLRTDRLTQSRRRPTETNSYVIQGEYGRILGAYRARFAAEQIHLELSEDLARDPGSVLDRVLEFLSLSPGYRPARLRARHHRGGARGLLDAESKASLLEFMEEHVWPRLEKDGERTRSLFNAFLSTWDIDPADEPPQPSARTRADLEAHYRADAEILETLGARAAWVRSWHGVP